MQQKNTNSKQPEVVVKPILKGAWNSKEAYRLAPKRTLSILLIGVVYVFFSVMAAFDNPVLRIIMSASVIGIAFFSQYTKGMEAGEKDAAYSEIMYERKQEGRTVSPEDEQRCFHPFRGAYATLLGAIPFVIICLIYAFMAKPWTYELGVLPGWMDNILAHNYDLDGARNYFRELKEIKPYDYAMIGYLIKNTITENGAVKRGVCEVKDNKLVKITECSVEEEEGKIIASPLDGTPSWEATENDIVSMNLSLFTPSFFTYIEKKFKVFLEKNKDDLSKCEFFMPDAVFDSIQEGYATVDVIKTEAVWYGVTYKEDLNNVKNALSKMVKDNIYPNNLWN